MSVSTVVLGTHHMDREVAVRGDGDDDFRAFGGLGVVLCHVAGEEALPTLSSKME
jgi:hypothetical protein